MMSSRWKFQLLTGSLWATFTVLFMCLAYKADGSLQERWEHGEILILTVFMYLSGIFLFGWFMWWQKERGIKRKNKSNE